MDTDRHRTFVHRNESMINDVCHFLCHCECEKETSGGRREAATNGAEKQRRRRRRRGSSGSEERRSIALYEFEMLCASVGTIFVLCVIAAIEIHSTFFFSTFFIGIFLLFSLSLFLSAFVRDCTFSFLHFSAAHLNLVIVPDRFMYAPQLLGHAQALGCRMCERKRNRTVNSKRVASFACDEC